MLVNKDSGWTSQVARSWIGVLKIQFSETEHTKREGYNVRLLT